MKKLIVCLICLLGCIPAFAQEIQTMTVPYEKGTLTFEYYEKDGIKVPHGEMRYLQETYINNKPIPFSRYEERGRMQHGIKEGVWTSEDYSLGTVTLKKLPYHKGLLEGEVEIHSWESKKSGYLMEIDYEKHNERNRKYTFTDGHIYGDVEIPVVFSGKVSDNIKLYAHIDKSGKGYGTWKKVSDDNVIYYDFDEDGAICKVYSKDLLGREIEYSKPTPTKYQYDGNSDFLPLDRLAVQLTKDLMSLPTLADDPYGYVRIEYDVK